MKTIVRLEKVSKRYGEGSENEVWGLREVSLEIEQGSFAAMVGPSGSGKSTLLNLVGGLDRPTSGDLYVDDRLTGSLSALELSRLRRDRIGFIFQAYNLLPVLTAFENAEYVLMLQGVAPDERRERAMKMLEAVGLKHLADRFPRQLSGGQQQRVAIARAIAANPALVLADEPTANLDSKTAEALLDLMVQLNQERGVTFVFSTHDPQVMRRAKARFILHDGQLASTEHGPLSG